MSKCSFCNSENVEEIKRNVIIQNRYVKSEGNTESSGTSVFYANKILCLDCGKISEVMELDDIKEYIEMKPYFK